MVELRYSGRAFVRISPALAKSIFELLRISAMALACRLAHGCGSTLLRLLSLVASVIQRLLDWFRRPPYVPFASGGSTNGGASAAVALSDVIIGGANAVASAGGAVAQPLAEAVAQPIVQAAADVASAVVPTLVSQSLDGVDPTAQAGEAAAAARRSTGSSVPCRCGAVRVADAAHRRPESAVSTG